LWPLACSRLTVWFTLEGPDGAALAAPAKLRAAEASAPAAMVEIARFYIVVNAPVSVRFSSLAPVLFPAMPSLCRDVSAVSVGRTARTGDEPHVPRPGEGEPPVLILEVSVVVPTLQPRLQVM
jgi:hypothetical protein